MSNEIDGRHPTSDANFPDVSRAPAAGRDARGHWMARRIAKLGRKFGREIASPRSRVGKAVYASRRWLRWRLIELRGMRPFVDDRTLVAFYDLAYWPITYDVAWFLSAAEMARQDAGLEGIHVVFVTTPDFESGNESTEYFKVIDGAARLQRVFDILIPSTALLPSIRGFTLTSTREQGSALAVGCAERTFPRDYLPELPHLGLVSFSCIVAEAASAGRRIPFLEAPAAARDWVRRWRRGTGEPRYVTITLRYFGWDPVRNSNLAAWGQFARELAAEGFHVVVVPDTHMTLDPLPPELEGLTLFVEAAWSVQLRAALYESAFLNLGINTGPMSLCWLNPRCRYIIYKQVLDAENVGNLQSQLLRGIDPRKPLPFATPYQKLVLEPDELPVIRREFEVMRGLIEADPVAAGIEA